MEQKIAAFDGNGNIVAYYDSVDSPVPAGVNNTLAISDAEWQVCISTPGYKVVGGALVAPPAPTAAQLAAQAAAAAWSAYQAKAQAALDKSDVTVLRCIENTVAVPAAWVSYRKALRAIVGESSGDATQPLPTQPAYPSGT